MRRKSCNHVWVAEVCGVCCVFFFGFVILICLCGILFRGGSWGTSAPVVPSSGGGIVFGGLIFVRMPPVAVIKAGSVAWPAGVECPTMPVPMILKSESDHLRED